MANFRFDCFAICVSCLVRTVFGVCTWPSDFVNSVWIDSQKGELLFDTTTMTGFTVDVFGSSTIDSWDCLEYNQTGSYLTMKTTTTFNLYVVNVYDGFRCLQLKKVTNYSYRYYDVAYPESQVFYDRVYIQDTAAAFDTSFLCQPGLGASGSEFQIMIKKGFEAAAAVICPYNLLADYTFAYSSSVPKVPCNPATDTGNVNMCSNITTIEVEKLTCSPYPVYSNSDKLLCVDVVTVGSLTFVSLYNFLQNSATIDGSSTYQFTCIGISSDGKSMSVTPNHCKANQSPTAVPEDNAGVKKGAVFTLSVTSAPCPTLTAPFRGNVTMVTDGAVTMATYVCDGNYTLAGSKTRLCQANGTWSGTQATCGCPVLSSPAGGTVTLSGDELAANFTCDKGSVLVGVSTLICDILTNTWIGTEPTCVNSSATTGEESSGNVLLPAVIVLAVLLVIAVAGFGGALVYICKTRANILDDKKTLQRSEESLHPPSFMFPSSKAPVDHKQHILEGRNPFLSMAAPTGHHPAPSLRRTESSSQRTIKSAASSGSVQLDLVRTTTNSVIFSHDNPAPWSKKPPKHPDSTNDADKTHNADKSESDVEDEDSILPAISKGAVSLTSPRGDGNKGHKKKKRTLSQKLQRYNSVNTTDDDTENHSKNVQNNMSNNSSVIVNKSGTNTNFTTVSLDLKSVNHNLKVTDPCRATPRSGPIAAVQ